ncbi:hypothetical protein GQ54DRAFT_297610 [Martensiomyces pterosporus]|nr:hypothetical protein GQ54DRAFT_297610 [Martensiomyces pterosporus]
MSRVYDIPHVDYVSQLSRHLVSVPHAKVGGGKRAGVAVVIRLVLPPDSQYPAFDTLNYGQDRSPASLIQAVSAFLASPSFRGARAQILFMQRARYPGDPWSGHIGFPGGKHEDEDENSKATAEREAREELALDLANEDQFIHLGELDNLGAYSFLNSRPLLVLSAHVYLQVCEATPKMELSDEADSIHWIDFDQVLRAIAQPCKPFSPEYHAIPADFASRLFPSYRRTQPLWYRVFRSIFGSCYYTVLPLRYTKEHSQFRKTQTPIPANDSSTEDAGSKYGDIQFSSDSELYLWGLSLCILSNLVDLSLPVEPRLLNSSYVSVASPWPQMDRYLWADVNFIINTVHRVVWSPYRRKPWYIKVQSGPSGRAVGNNTDFFILYFRVYKTALLFSCLWKSSLAYILGRSCIRAIARIMG